ncbi:extracellular solute-binding protein [Solwaraspora sp. WMMA2080]|uniref:ABC transporter substrate-binding protein n=1 Tax=unclassified Solwaraspora TaxID=2627926 RepID=UPI00248B00A7|nr:MULTISPECIES: extracellular solute-binding protein [unclassified Solwaraspora]WBB95100.1 extracellular solute-binding protein [Solwaraspora sp. WMMA2059]WBC21016.1 extracellular solute-binding protein [Solwaraspora sp. WMMA2080]
MFRRQITSTRTLIAAALTATALTLSACGADADDSGDGSTLRLWHYEGVNSAMGIAWAEAIKQFEASHPGVTVVYEEKGFEQIRQNAGMILNSDEGPDILEYNKGNASAGLLSKQGLLTDLSDVVAERGWDEMISPSVATTCRYDGNGVMGGDTWYGIPNYGEFVMVYYNKDMFAEYDLSVPTTFAEFEGVLDTFVDNGVTPISVGGAEYPAQQILYELALTRADRSFVDDFQLYANPVDFHGPEFSYAATTFAEWVDKGYIGADSAGIKAEDMGVAFTQGSFPIMISGSWWYGRMSDEITDFEWGTFLFPGSDLHPGSGGNIWVVPSNAKNKDLAYDFIDITMQPDIQNLLGESGGVPLAADPAAITNPKAKELIENFNTLNDSDGLAFYPDWPAPGYYDVLVAGVQQLINDSKSPDEVLDEIAKPYNDNLASIGE